MNFTKLLKEYFSTRKYPAEFELIFKNNKKAIEAYDHYTNCFLYESCEIKRGGDIVCIKLKKRKLGTGYMFEMRTEVSRKILKKTRIDCFKNNQVLNVFDIAGSVSLYTDILLFDRVVIFDLLKDYEWDLLPWIKIQTRKRSNIFYVKTTASLLPSEDEKADVVICLELFEHLDNDTIRLQVITEIKRILKRGGILIFSTPNIKDWIGMYKGLIKDDRYRHHGIWDYQMMQSVIEDNEFKILYTSGTQLDIHFLNPALEKFPILIILIHFINSILEIIPYGKRLKHQMIIVAEK